MENIICCGFGHRQVFADIAALLHKQIETLIIDENVCVFLTGSMGEFDRLFSSAVRALKQKYPHIKLISVKPYLSNEINQYGKVYEQMFDDVIIPDELADVHYKAIIGKRNRWMVDKSDFVICYVYDDFGGAYQAVRYADKQGKRIYNLTNLIHPKAAQSNLFGETKKEK